jgi:MFS family permease
MIFFILFTRYVIATFLSAFFPQVTTQQGISGTWEGIIFAAYPIGMAITSVLAPTSILKWGTRTSVMIGLFTCGISTAMFGLVPDFVNFIGNSDVRVLQYLYTGAYFLNGFFGGLADTGVLILVSSKFKDDIGVVFATIGTVCGVGCMVGPLVGATFYACTNNAVWKFRLPFMLTGIVPILLCMLCPFTLPQVYTAEDADDAKDINGTDVMNSTNDTNNGGSDEESRSSTRQKQSRKGCSHALRVLSTPAVALSVCAIALSGTIVATLDPTLAFRLSTCKHNCTADGSAAHNVSSFPAWVDGHPAPFDLTEAEVAFFFTYSSITYVAVSIPIGWIVDRYQSNARVFKLIQAFGFFLLSLTFALLGPLRLPSAFGGVTVEHSMNSMYCAAIALILKGLGSATNNAAYPDMVIGIDENDDVLSAIMSGAWNAAYSIGWAFGPLLGGALYEAVQFDGFATIISAVSLLYALILLFAVSCCKDNRERDAP